MVRHPSSDVNFLCQNALKLRNLKFFNQIRYLATGGGGGDVGVVKMKQQQELAEIVREVCKTIRTQPRWEHSILSHFTSLNLFEPNCVLEIIKCQKNALLSFRFFQWLCSQQGISPDTETCKTLFNILVESKASKAAISLLNSSKFCPDPASLESLLRCLCQEGATIPEALDVLSQFKSLGFVPSLVVCNAALLASLRVGRTDLVWEFYGHMMDFELVGDVDTAGYLIQAFCEDNKLFEAYELLQQSLDTGHAPDIISFTKLISGFCKRGKYNRVSELLHLMIAKNRTPNIFTYQEIIYGLCKNGMGFEGFRVFNDLKERGYVPDRVMYTTMIDGLCKMDRMGEAQKLWFEMIQKGFIPNEYTYNVLINGYCKTGKLEEAQKLCMEMRSRGHRESLMSCNTMIAGLCSHGRMGEAFALFKEMPKKGIDPDVVTYNTLIQGFCKTEKTVEAMKLYHELLATGLQPSASSCTPLIQALCKLGKTEQAISLWNSFQSRGEEPLICTRDYIITGLCKEGNATEGMEWLSTMLRSKLRPQKKTFNSLIECLSWHDRLDDALLVLDSMLGMGYTPGEPICHSLVGQLCKGESYCNSGCLMEILEKN